MNAMVLPRSKLARALAAMRIMLGVVTIYDCNVRVGVVLRRLAADAN